MTNTSVKNDVGEMMKLNKSRGFTLIELMIVVAIIGILAAIAIPQFSVYRSNAFNSTALSDLRTIATAEEAYHVDQMSYVNLQPIIGFSAYQWQQKLPIFAIRYIINPSQSTEYIHDSWLLNGYSESRIEVPSSPNAFIYPWMLDQSIRASLYFAVSMTIRSQISCILRWRSR